MEIHVVRIAAGQLVDAFGNTVGKHNLGIQKSNRRLVGVQSRLVYINKNNTLFRNKTVPELG